LQDEQPSHSNLETSVFTCGISKIPFASVVSVPIFGIITVTFAITSYKLFFNCPFNINSFFEEHITFEINGAKAVMTSGIIITEIVQIVLDFNLLALVWVCIFKLLECNC